MKTTGVLILAALMQTCDGRKQHHLHKHSSHYPLNSFIQQDDMNEDDMALYAQDAFSKADKF